MMPTAQHGGASHNEIGPQDVIQLAISNVKGPHLLNMASANAKAEINPPEEIVAQVRGVEIYVVGVNVMNSYREVAHACQ